MSRTVDGWVEEIEEALFDAADRLPQRELRAGLLGAVHGGDFGGYIAEQVSQYTSDLPYEDEVGDERSYSLGEKAIERFEEEYTDDWRGMTESMSFAAGQLGGMMAPGAVAAATMNPVFLGGYAVGPAADALNYIEDTYGDTDIEEPV
jgi:hypothetical protein